MLARFVKFIRMMVFYILYFFLGMFIVVTTLETWQVGWQMLFAFGAPAVLVWVQENRRSKRKRLQVEPEALSVGVAPVAEISRLTENDRREARQRVLEKRIGEGFDTAAVDPQPASLSGQENASLAEIEHNWRERLKGEKGPYPLDENNAAAIEDIRLRRERHEAQRTKTETVPDIRKSSLAKATRSWQGWVPKGEHAVVANRDIGGMVYVGAPLRLNGDGYYTNSRPYIDPSLRVDAWGSDKLGTQMSYWPGYSDIPPICRATYLDWLADGRRDARYNPGYMFLYFYGLERRFLVDQPEEGEKRDILDEVRRLAVLFSDNGSAQRYLGEFIEIAQMAVRDPAAEEPIFEFRGWELPFRLKAVIGGKVAQEEPLSWDWALSWLICHPEHYLRTPATRCPDEFRALFRLRFEERFPNGLKVTKPRKTLSMQYQAASREFSVSASYMLDGKPVPDISGIRKPVEIAQEIVDEVTEALDRLSRYLGRNPEGRGSIEAQALLPAELRALFPSEALESLKAWAAEQVAQGGLVPAADVIARIEGAPPDKLNKSRLIGAADTLARIGYGLAPDPRFALRSPKLDEPLVIYALASPIENLEEVTPAYRAALLELALGAFVVQADGRISDAERQALTARIEQAADIGAPERLSLKANMDWLLAVPSDMALLRRKLKDTGPEAHVALRAALIAAAHADGVIQPEEVAGIEKLYKALGLDPALVYSDIHAGDVLDGPVRVKPEVAGAPGEAIPQETPAPAAKLDPALIAAIRSDTARVSSVLGEIFGAEEAVQESAPPEAAKLLKGLDGAMTALVREIVEEMHLTEDTFEAACKRHGLLAAGALEAINEWAFETYDEALLDAYDGYDVAPEIAAAVKAQFAKEDEHVHA